jgi:hypothetical protein
LGDDGRWRWHFFTSVDERVCPICSGASRTVNNLASDEQVLPAGTVPADYSQHFDTTPWGQIITPPVIAPPTTTPSLAALPINEALLRVEEVIRIEQQLKEIDSPYQDRIAALEQDIRWQLDLGKLLAHKVLTLGPGHRDYQAAEGAYLITKQKILELRDALAAIKLERQDQALLVMRTERPAEFAPKFARSFTIRQRAVIQRGLDAVGSITVDRYGISELQIKLVKNRAWQSPGALHLTRYSDPATAAHELGHEIETNNPAIHRRCVEFLHERTAGEQAAYLGDNYDRREIGKRDKFIDPYTGKIYGPEGGETATEVLSMGLTHLLRDAVGFARHDPEHFRFTIAILRGLLT